MTIMVTGSAGMIGSNLVKGLLDKGYEVVGVDRKCGNDTRCKNVVVDLGDVQALQKIVVENHVDRIIHLAALAHTAGEDDLSWEKYHYVNVVCAKNVFDVAQERPVLFISTADVYGFVKGVVNADTELHPVTPYGKSKAMAEAECKNTCKQYTIFRFQPVYTNEIKRDIQKRYYLKYPNWAYVIGKNTEYEVLSIENAVNAMVNWCDSTVDNRIFNIKDKERMNPVNCIEEERAEGRAKRVLYFPRWMVKAGFGVIKFITGKNKYTYLLNKAVNPLRTE